MAPCSSSVASLNLNHSQQASPTGTRTYAECKLLQPGDTPSSLSSLSLAAKSLTSPLWQLMPGWGHSPSTAPVTVTDRWSRDEPTINHQNMNNRTSAQNPGLQKMSSLAKAGEGFGWEMTHSRYREQRALSLCALSDLRFHLSWSDIERCCGWVAGLLINRLSLKLHLQDPPPTIKLSFDLHSNSQKQEKLCSKT